MKAGLRTTAALAAFMVFSVDMALAKEPAETTAPTYSFSGAYLAGRAAEFDNDLESAAAYYERALSFDPDNAELQQSLMLTLISQGRVDEALPLAEKLKAEPEVERFSRLALAVDAFRKDDFAAAEQWLKLVVESDLDRLITGTMTAWAKLGQGDAEAAANHLDELEGPAWYGLFTAYQRALILAQAGRDAEAKEAFESVFADLAPRSVAPDTFGRIAEAYAAFLSSRGETEEALAVLDRTEEAGGGIATIQVLRERLDAGDRLEPLVATPAHGASEILLNLATELANGGGESFVRLYLHYGLALRPENDAILVQLARVAERQQESERAIELYEKIGDGSPWTRFAEFQIGLNLADLDRNDEAVSHLKTVLEEDPSDLRAYLALGGVYSAQKDYEAAAELYDRAVEQIEEPSREHWNIFYQRGIAYERLKQWPKAEPNFRTALELFPDHPQVLNYLGYSWVDMNMNLDEAMDLIRRAVEVRPSDGYIVDSLGWAHYRLGEYEEAVEHLERAVSLRPDDAVLNDHLGDAYWRVGRRLEARYQWSHARDLDPEPDLLASVEKKLEEGLPPEEGRQVAEAAPAASDVVNDSAGGAETARRSEDGAQEAEVAPDAAEAAAEEAEPETREALAPSAPPAVETQRQGPYVVKRGDSLWAIAAEQLGSGARYMELLRLNPQFERNPDLILPGDSVHLP